MLELLRAYLAARRFRTLRVPPVPPLTISEAEARAYAEQELATGISPLPPYSFGLSSGTTGPPSVFITTPAERGRWAGNILGKYIPPHRLLGLRVALFLKHNNRLYAGVRGLRYYGLTPPYPDLLAWRPHVLVGPPSVLLQLPDGLRPHTVLAGAEPLFPVDRETLTHKFQVAPRGLYQAREGFLAYGCAHGRYHLNEDLLAFRLQPFTHDSRRVLPVITDLVRQTQPQTNRRVDDVLLLAPSCPCGSPFTAVETVEGRLLDLMVFRDRPPKFPLELAPLLPPGAALFQNDYDDFTVQFDYAPPPGQKHRRFQRLFDPGNTLIEPWLQSA
jgi:putative adenylate-forming enzyme